MNEDTIVHLRHLSGRKGRPALIEFRAGEPLIKAGAIVNVICALRNGVVSTEPGPEQKPFYREHFGATPENLALIGASSYFTGEPSAYTFRAESDCQALFLDSAFRSRPAEDGQHEDVLRLAKSLILNSDITHVILPVVRRRVELFEALAKNPGMSAEKIGQLRKRLEGNFSAPTHTLGTVIDMDLYVRDAVRAEHLRRAALEMFDCLCLRRTRITKVQSLVRATLTLPPPPPGKSLERRVWEAARA